MAVASTTPPRPDREGPSGAVAGRPRKRRRWLWWVIGSVVVVVFAPLILFSAYNGLAGLFVGGCSDAERSALTEFPHYGGITAEPEANGEGLCFVNPPVGDPPDDVIAFYREQLTEHGWTFDESEQQEGETSEGAFEAGSITAHREGLLWDLLYEAEGGRTIALVVYVSEA
jgi:hypothetical protein